MADEQNTTDKPWIATLMRGTRYVFAGVPYKKGEDMPVDEETKLKLEKKAVDPHIIDGEFDEDGNAVIEYRKKFQFRRAGEKAPAARRRAPVER